MSLLSGSAINPRLADIDTLRMKLMRGDLVARPFENGHFLNDSFGGTASVNYGLINQDGSDTGLFVQVAAGFNGARVQVPFVGRAFGVRFRRALTNGLNTSQTPDEFSVRIDGVAFAVPTTLLKAKLYGQTIEDDLCGFLISDDLPEGEHLAELTFVAPATGNDQIFFASYLVERRAGYLPVPNTDCVLTPATGAEVGVASSAIYDCQTPTTPSGTFGMGRRVSSIHYHNNTGGVAVVTIKINGIFFKQLTITDKDSAVLNFTPPIATNATWTHSSPQGGPNLPYFVFGSF